MARAIDTANYFLATLGSDPESDLTNLKMQKLCAYAQAVSLALLNRPLFDERIEAWKHGPVVPSVYETFRENGDRVIPGNGLSEKFAREPFDDKQKFVLEMVARYYGRFSAWGLRERSHDEFPGLFGSKRVIQNDDIARRFRELPEIRKLLDYQPPKPESLGRMLSEREFWDAVSA